VRGGCDQLIVHSYIGRDVWLGANYSVRLIHARFTDKRQLDTDVSGGHNTFTNGTFAHDKS
jgi:hypothetical protein